MHERAAAEVDADVRVLLAVLVEEEEVAALQACALDRVRGKALRLRVARNGRAGQAEAVIDEAAAIEPGRCRAAEAIGFADQGEGMPRRFMRPRRNFAFGYGNARAPGKEDWQGEEQRSQLTISTQLEPFPVGYLPTSRSAPSGSIA